MKSHTESQGRIKIYKIISMTEKINTSSSKRKGLVLGPDHHDGQDLEESNIVLIANPRTEDTALSILIDINTRFEMKL